MTNCALSLSLSLSLWETSLCECVCVYVWMSDRQTDKQRMKERATLNCYVASDRTSWGREERERERERERKGERQRERRESNLKLLCCLKKNLERQREREQHLLLNCYVASKRTSDTSLMMKYQLPLQPVVNEIAFWNHECSQINVVMRTSHGLRARS